MSLFTELYALTKARRFAMLVTSDHEAGLMTISVMPRPHDDRDGPYCKDLTLTARPEEFDAGFLDAIATYRSKLLPMLEQLGHAESAIDKAAQATAQTPAKRSANADAKGPEARGKPKSPDTSLAAKAREYRDASCGETTAEDEPDNDWMKNRQPELF